MQVWSLGQEDPLEEEMATHSSILAWKNPMGRGVWWAAVHGVAESRTQVSTHSLAQSVKANKWDSPKRKTNSATRLVSTAQQYQVECPHCGWGEEFRSVLIVSDSSCLPQWPGVSGHFHVLVLALLQLRDHTVSCASFDSAGLTLDFSFLWDDSYTDIMLVLLILTSAFLFLKFYLCI